MASFDTVDYSNVKGDKIYKLSEIARECERDFPIVVNIIPPDYEVMFGNYLPFNEDMLLDKPKVVEYVRVKILPFTDVDEIRKTKGPEFVEARNKYIGKEFLLPLKYPGKLQIINKRRRNRYTSMSQVIDDLPDYIKVYQMTECKSPVDGSIQTINQGTVLKIESVTTLQEENIRHINCISSDNETLVLTENCPINGKALHTFATIVEGNVALPITAIFEQTDPDDILIWDDDEASDMLVLMSGPISIHSVSTYDVFVAWLKTDEICEKRKLALIPEKAWPATNLEISQFSNETEKYKYMKTCFGCYYESDFIQNSLYKMTPHENGVVFLSEPRVNDTSNGDYEKPISISNTKECIPASPPLPATFQVTEEKENGEEILLPTALKTNKETPLEKLMSSFGFDRVQNPSHKHTNNNKKQRGKAKRSDTHELIVLPPQVDQSVHLTSQTDTQHASANTEQTGPSFPSSFQSSSGTKPKQVVRPIKSSPSVQRKDMPCKTNTLAKLVDINKISRPNQTKEDFYSYTPDEVVECFKLCGLDTLARDCSVHNIDGACFRDITQSDLKTYFNVDSIDAYKVKKTIEEGWRARLRSQ